MMTLTRSNYFSSDAAKAFWSVSQFKAFQKCEAAGLAAAMGEYERETTTALLVGSYVDAFFTGEKGALGQFAIEHPEIFKKDGSLKAEFKQAETMIERVRRDPLMVEYLKGENQTIMTADLFGVQWKIKMDVYNPSGEEPRIVDLKTVKDFDSVYEEGFGRRAWVEYWGYDIQGAVYQKVEQIASGRDKPLPFYIVAVTKEKTPDIAVIRLPQHILDTALKVVEAKIDRFDLVKTGEVPPVRCERCEYCKSTKILTEPMIYEVE